MSNKETTMKPEMVSKGKMYFVGMNYYGQLTGEGWSEENPIGNLWKKITTFRKTKWNLIEDSVVDEDVAYEIHIWNEEEFKTTKCFHVFVGVEVEKIEDIPLELVSKVLPAGTYAVFSVKGTQITTWEKDIYEEWLPQSEYEEVVFDGYQFHIQCYGKRFKGLDRIEESEIDVYIPVNRK